MKRRNALPAVAFLLGTAGVAFAGFVDDFDDGVIDPGLWEHGGAITESGGYLNLDRQEPGDYIRTVSTYGGDWNVEMNIRLNYILWNDMFHGVSFTNDTGAYGEGMSFGYSQYGKLYLAYHHPGGNAINYYYGSAGSNQPGQWLSWVFQKSGTNVTVSVNGQPITWGPASVYVPGDIKVRMPGLYQDGDGEPHVGFTSSDVDFISLDGDVSTAVREANVQPTTWARIKTSFR